MFDFDSRDSDANFNTLDGILLNSVLQTGKEDSLQRASELGTHGMGNVGKTTAFRKI